MEKPGPTAVTDHLHLINQVAHHDAALSAFGSRMSAVEGTLSHVQDKVMALDSKMSAGFGSLESLIRENRASQGPRMGEILKGVATGGAIIAMSAGAITMLVTSFVKPELVTLQQTTTELKKADQDREALEKAELLALRERRREQVDQTLQKLNDHTFRLKGAWETNVTKGSGM